MRKIILAILMALLMFSVNVSAEMNFSYYPEGSDYTVNVWDFANILDENSQTTEDLLYQMEQISQYGHVALYAVDYNTESTTSLAKEVYREQFGTESGCLFMVDLDNREIFFFCDGAIYKTINKSVSYTITDNVYRYAKDGDYDLCALNAFYQIQTKLGGGSIATPMRFLSAGFFSMLLALMITFIIAKKNSAASLTKESEYMKGLLFEQNLKDANRSLIRQEKHKKSSSSGGGGGGGGHGSSGGGGGHGF